MSYLSADTSAEADRAHVEILRALGVKGRARLLFELCRQTRATTRSGIRRRHPEYDDRQVELAEFKLRLGSELFETVYPGVVVDP